MPLPPLPVVEDCLAFALERIASPAVEGLAGCVIVNSTGGLAGGSEPPVGGAG